MQANQIIGVINKKIRLSQNHSKNPSQSSLPKNILNNNFNKKLEPKIFKTNRSSTTHLNQYSKMVLESNQDMRKSSLLKRTGQSMNNLAQFTSAGNTKREFEGGEVNTDYQKIQQFLNTYKKKILDENPKQMNKVVTFTQSNQQFQSRLIKRNIQTAQSQPKKSLHKVSSSNGNMPTIGKLHLGKNVAPLILPKQQRLNPFHNQPYVITQNLINSKGIYNLISSGFLPKKCDFNDILNNKYQLIQDRTIKQVKQVPKQQVMKIQQDNEAFMTNPILMSQYEQHKKQSQAQLIDTNRVEQQSRKQSRNKTRKTNLKKIKKIKSNPLDKLAQMLSSQSLPLTMIQSKIVKDESYNTYYRNYLKQGIEFQFNELIQKMQMFTNKYNLKKINFKPNIFFNKETKEIDLLKMIENYKILGYDKAYRNKQARFQATIFRAVQMFKYKKIKMNLQRIQRIKKYFRIKRLYHANIDKRYNFFKYRLGSFAEEQRKFIEDFIEQGMYKVDFDFNIQIHILTKSCSYSEEMTYYKLKERLRSQMMRLYNTKAKQIVFLVDPDVVGDVKTQMEVFFKMVDKMNTKLEQIKMSLPTIHIFTTTLKGQNISHTGRTYFGIGQQIIEFVRSICQEERPVIIPYESSQYLPLICQTLGANLFGGSYTKQSIKLIFDQDAKDQQQYAKMKKKQLQQQQANKNSKTGIKPNKGISIQKQKTFQQKISKLKTFQMANQYYQNKGNIYKIFTQVKNTNKQIQIPFRLCVNGKDKIKFLKQLVQKIILHKQSTKWMLKLSKGKFSRGLASLQTNDLKVFKEKRKKAYLSNEDIEEVSKIMEDILKDKIILSHPTLIEKHQYLDEFFKDQNAYVQEFIENSNKICVFGKILPNGRFTFMGTYKKYYTNGVGFGASYPASQFTQQMLQQLQQISKLFSEQNVFGYATYQFMYQQKTNKLFYLDFTPNLQEYSTLYFYYSSFFKIESLTPEEYEFNKLPKSIFYCPFLDNNGNRIQDIEQFLEQCRNKKIWYNSMNQEGQKFLFLKNDPSMLSLLTFNNSQYQSIKSSIDAIAFLVNIGGKFNQFDKKYIGTQNLKCDGLYMMDILWKLRQMKKKVQTSQQSDKKNPLEILRQR